MIFFVFIFLQNKNEKVKIIFDLETTGLDYTKDAIIQYTFLNYQTDEYISGYVNPQRPMTKEASDITGVTDIDLKEYQPFSNHVEKILNFIGKEKETYLIAHNGDRFDKLFLSAALLSCGKSLSPFWKFIDTLKLYRHFFSGISTIHYGFFARKNEFDDKK